MFIQFVYTCCLCRVARKPENFWLEEKRFRKLVRRMEPWYAVTAYAYHKGGAAQLFNFLTDREKVQDGDTMVYIGNQSKALAQSFNDMLDVEVMSAKEIRKSVNREKSKTLIH